MTEWFEQWFGEEYHALYPHRDAEDARRAVTLVQRVAPWRPGDRVLDLACGNGRHAAELERAGARVIGLDLSAAMLHRARGRTQARLTRGDMRALPFRRASFALAVNLFTSFGYFRDDNEHGNVLGQVAEVLVPGGHLVLDYLNAEQVRKSLQPGSEEYRSGPPAVRIRRRYSENGRYVVKEIELRDEDRSFLERVRLFTAAELEQLLGQAGFRIAQRFGDYDGGALTPESARVILVGTRT